MLQSKLEQERGRTKVLPLFYPSFEFQLHWLLTLNRSGILLEMEALIVALLQGALELLFEGIVHFGFTCGLVSLSFFPKHILGSSTSRIAQLVLAPILLGAAFGLRSERLQKTGRITLQLRTFFYTASFVFALGLTRFLLAE